MNISIILIKLGWSKKAEIYDFTGGISSVKVHQEYWREFDSDNSKPLICSGVQSSLKKASERFHRG